MRLPLWYALIDESFLNQYSLHWVSDSVFAVVPAIFWQA